MVVTPCKPIAEGRRPQAVLVEWHFFQPFLPCSGGAILTRREPRRAAFVAAVLFTAVAVVVVWQSNSSHPPRTFDAKQLPPTPVLNAPGSEPFVSFYVLGDTGSDTPARADVVRKVAAYRQRHPADHIVLAGDNFYPRGVSSIQDPRWQTDFEEAFPKATLDLPFYVALGNHDYKGNAQAQVDYSSRGTRWHMPSRYYHFSQDLGTHTIETWVLDTDPIHRGDSLDQTEPQRRWLAETLADSEARWKVVIGHHPILSGGEHGADPNVSQWLRPIFAEAGVHLYISGHDHDLQLHRSDAGWLQLVCGSGCSVRDTRWIDSTLFAKAEPGFAWVVAT